MGLVRAFWEWQALTGTIIIIVYVIAPVAGLTPVPLLLTVFGTLNMILNFFGATWLSFTISGPPPLGASFFIYWETFALFVMFLYGLAKLILYGALYATGNRTRTVRKVVVNKK